MALPVRRSAHSLRPELSDWFDPFAIFGMRPFSETQGIRIEDYVADGRYTVRAEIPGIDPDRDLTITVADGLLTIRAERTEEKTERHHSEFRYGAFQRSVRLPARVREDDISATYTAGVLTIDVPLEAPPSEAKTISVKHAE
jgi:HSP20 family molecular chaperone IbpA